MDELNREQVLEYDRNYNQHPWLTGNVNAIPVERAEGIYFWDYNGKKYYDMSSQLANVNLGYGNKDIIEAIKKQVDILPYIAPAYASGPRSKLAKMLIDLAPDNMGKVFFSSMTLMYIVQKRSLEVMPRHQRIILISLKSRYNVSVMCVT